MPKPVLSEEMLNELKRKTGDKATKDSIATAVDHFLRCSYTQEEPLKGKPEEAMKKRR